MLSVSRHDLWILRRLIVGHTLNGEGISRPLRGLAEHLDGLPAESRGVALRGYLCGREDADRVIADMAGIDPEAPPPETGDDAPRFATVADVRRTLSGTRWHWVAWIPANQIVGIAAFEGVGKTRAALDLCRRAHLGLDWPDGQKITLPVGSRSVWICADAHQDELAEILPEFGLPDEAIVFATPPDEPYGGVDLDDPDTMKALEAAIVATNPAFVVIDTLTSATSRDLCDQRTVKPLKAALAHLAQTYQVTIILLLHLNREGQALGRRIKGLTRTLIHLECSDPEKPERLRMWVEKSYDRKPLALGVTMGKDGNKYDSTPPSAPVPNPPGRKPAERDKAVRFLLETLAKENDRIGNDLCAEWEKTGGSGKTFWRAVEELVAARKLAKDGGPGTKRQVVLHLIQTEDKEVILPMARPDREVDDDRPF